MTRSTVPLGAMASAAAVGSCAVVAVTGWVYPLLVPVLVLVGVVAAKAPLPAALVVLAAAVAAPLRWVPTLDRGLLLTVLVTLTWGGALIWSRARERARTRVRETVAASAVRAVAEERLRIARDLHDLVAHGMSIITVHLGYGAHAATDHPERAVESLRVIETTGRETLAQLRELLTVLRADSAPTEHAWSSDLLVPAPGLDALPELLERTRPAGLTVDVETSGNLADLPADIALCVYRVVQEGQTNVLRHSPVKQARLVLARTATGVELAVVNVLASMPSASPGHGSGLIGVRERVTLLGGSSSATREGDTFTLRVSVPVRTDSPGLGARTGRRS